MLTHGTLQTQFSEVDVTEVLASDWWIFGKSSGIFGKGPGMVGKARGKKAGKEKKKKRGGVGGGRQERKREGWAGWVMTSSKK